MFGLLCGGSSCCSLCTAATAVALLWLLYKLLDRHFRSQRLDVPADSRAVLITGCDSGFGRLLATRLSSKGWCVIAACLTEKAADELAGLDYHKQHLVPIVMDVTSTDSVEAGVTKTAAALSSRGIKGLWGLVNNAGVAGSKMGPTDLLSAKDFHEVFNVNVYGIVTVSRAFLPLMRRLRRSRLVNTSSIFGRFATPGTAAYAASKFAVQAVSDCQRRELRQFGVHVACLEPGFHRTAITDRDAILRGLGRAFDEAPAELRDAYGEDYRSKSADALDVMLRMCSERLDDVVDAYEEALTAKWPRCRYMVGRDAKYFYWPLAVLPEFFADSLAAWRMPRAAGAVA